MISTICQYDVGKYCVADYSQPGYFLLDIKTGSTKPIIDVRKSGHYTGCTSLLKPPQFHLKYFPYLFARTK